MKCILGYNMDKNLRGEKGGCLNKTFPPDTTCTPLIVKRA